MALVGQIVAQFKAETADYMKKTADLKARNRETAADLIKTAGSAEAAIATLTVAKRSGDDLGALGLDKRNLSGVIGQIKELAKEGGGAGENIAKSMKEAAGQAGALGDVANDTFDAFARGDYLKAFEKLKTGMAELKESGGLSEGLKATLTVGIMGKVASATAEATAKAVELREQYNAGAMSAGDMVEGIWQALPVLGDIRKAGLNIRELLGLENRELEKQNELLKTVNDARQRTLDIAKDIRAFADKQNQTTEDIKDDTEIANLKAQGDVAGAAAKERSVALKRELRAASDEINQWAAAEKKRLMETGAKDGKSLDQQLKDAADAKRAAEDLFTQSQTDWEIDKGQAEEKKNTATENYNRIKSAVDERDKQLAGIDPQAKALNEDRSKAINDRAAAKAAADAATDAGKGATSITDTIGNALAGLKITATPITDWIKEQADAAKKELERIRDDANRFAEQVKSPAHKLQDDLNRAVAASKAAPGTFSKEALGQYLGQTKADLLDQKASLEAGLNQRVYDLPKITDGSQAGTLYAPPTRQNEKSLKALEQISQKLNKLDEIAKNAGVNIQVIN